MSKALNKAYDSVNPAVGSLGKGHCPPGPFLPFGIVHLSPDGVRPQPTHGYKGETITGFSHLHVSGTGGGGRYGNVRIIPFLGDDVVDSFRTRMENAVFEPAYCRVAFPDTGIHAEFTVSEQAAIHRYKDVEKGQGWGLLIDAGSVIQTVAEVPEDTGICIGGYMQRSSSDCLEGRSDFKGGWGSMHPYSIYYFIRFRTVPPRVLLGTDSGWSRAVSNYRMHMARQSRDWVEGKGCRANVFFAPGSTVECVVGLSFVSVANARTACDDMIGQDSLEEVTEQGRKKWEHLLGRNKVETQKSNDRDLFFTMSHRIHGMPKSLGIDWEMPRWKSGIPQFTDFYALWDSARCANAYFFLFESNRGAEWLNALLDIADHTGWLPDAWIANQPAFMQGTSSADYLFAEACLKGLQGVDYEKALHYMRKNAEVDSPDRYLYGRYRDLYEKYGYLPSSLRWGSVSRSLEYNYQDLCISRLASAIGAEAIAGEYRNRAQRVWNLWREDLKCFAPKSEDGIFLDPFDPWKRTCEGWMDPYFYEGPSVAWSFQVFSDFPELVERHGGPDLFVDHLDSFYESGVGKHKETELHIPYLYHFAGRPGLSSKRVREIFRSHYKLAPDGLMDNEDMGCQSAWCLWAMMGIFPLMGQELYLLTAPLMDELAMDINGCAELVIQRTGDGEFIKKVELNGKPLDRAWLCHDELSSGAELKIHVTHSETNWGQVQLPPAAINHKTS